MTAPRDADSTRATSARAHIEDMQPSSQIAVQRSTVHVALFHFVGIKDRTGSAHVAEKIWRMTGGSYFGLPFIQLDARGGIINVRRAPLSPRSPRGLTLGWRAARSDTSVQFIKVTPDRLGTVPAVDFLYQMGTFDVLFEDSLPLLDPASSLAVVALSATRRLLLHQFGATDRLQLILAAPRQRWPLYYF